MATLGSFTQVHQYELCAGWGSSLPPCDNLPPTHTSPPREPRGRLFPACSQGCRRVLLPAPLAAAFLQCSSFPFSPPYAFSYLSPPLSYLSSPLYAFHSLPFSLSFSLVCPPTFLLLFLLPCLFTPSLWSQLCPAFFSTSHSHSHFLYVSTAKSSRVRKKTNPSAGRLWLQARAKQAAFPFLCTAQPVPLLAPCRPSPLPSPGAPGAAGCTLALPAALSCLFAFLSPSRKHFCPAPCRRLAAVVFRGSCRRAQSSIAASMHRAVLL